MTVLTKENFNWEIKACEKLAVIDLWAAWCGPCRMLAPVMEELEREHPEVLFFKINVDEQPELAEKFKVESIPMLAFVKNDVFLDFSIGYVPKENIEKLIEQYK